MGFFDQSQSNVEKIVEWSLNLTLFCHLHYFNVCNFLPDTPLPPTTTTTPLLVEILLFFSYPLWIKQNCIHPGIWVFLPEEYRSTMKNFVEFKASSPHHPPAKEIVFFSFNSTPKQILNFLKLPLKNFIGPQPDVRM